MIGRAFWKLADPFLLRLRARLEHLEEIRPSTRRDAQLRAMGIIAGNAVLEPTAAFSNPGPREHLRIGDYARIRGEIRVLTPDARITVGDHCHIGPQTRIWAAKGVTIGRYVLIAHLVDIIDNNSHSLSAADRRREAEDLFERGIELDFSNVSVEPIVIEDDAWIGAKSTILKGVRIGRGAVVAANTLVTSDVEPYTLVAGNPARVLRALPEDV